MSGNRARDLVNLAISAGLDPGKPFLRHSSVCVEAYAQNGHKATFRILNKPGGKDDLEALGQMRRFARQNPAPLPCQDEPTTPQKKEEDVSDLNPNTIRLNKKKPVHAPAATEAPAAPIPEATAARDLTAREILRLSNWLLNVVDRNMENHPNLEALAAAATVWTGAPVSVEAMREVMEASEVPEPAHWAAPVDPQVVVLRELMTLFDTLGHKPSPQFQRLLDTLAA